MQKELREIPNHMQLLGRNSLAHALTLIIDGTDTGSEYGYYQSELGVLMAAHAAEILLKARLAEKDPLLIFTKRPELKGKDLLEIQALFEEGRTIAYQDLPERVWAETGYRLENQHLYKEFGKLRNNIQHFAPSKSYNALTQATLEFVFKVVDPFLREFWRGYAITCLEYPEDLDERYALLHRLVFWEIDFECPNEEYEEMKQRAIEQLKGSHRGKDVLAYEEANKGEATMYYKHRSAEVWRKGRSDEGEQN